MTRRLEARIRRDFPEGSVEAVLARLEAVELGSVDQRGTERVQAAIVLLAAGDWRALERAAKDAEIDWRDVLVAADLGYEDWPTRLDDMLGVENPDG